MDHTVSPWVLRWDEVDPGHHPFDGGPVRDFVRGIAPTVPARLTAAEEEARDWWDHPGEAWADSVTASLMDRYGSWAAGWRWAKDEGDFGGGPVGSWCCARHSLASTEDTVARVADALVEWRGWLEELAECFDQYPLADLPEPERLQAWERGAVRLVHHVVERTAAGDAWYRHCAQVLTWFLARWGVAGDVAAGMVDGAIGGRFDSWIVPADTLVDDVAEHIARAATAANPSP
ncbi:hypothetical protein [Actinokineospora globicatena]|uniref:hypothetical protein n=1 Tax=Actinokineospora globicatena TaxID=103729 RepID=UPI0020A42211|nr:hypothetical protein [Actinokineospora globicatena]GLW81031.1 hypothetical protein Aglo01_55120 [Actinokineospora globicatena]GLW88224.1 hypothetical protein Aglo02_58630 [Actinokineospora globicatena]